MAKIEFKGFEEYQKQIAELANPRTVRAMARYSIYPAADMAAQELKNAVPMDTGDLRDSVIITPMKTDDSGFTSTTVTFAGYDRKGQPNPVKARVLESGRSTADGGVTAKHPFMRKAIAVVKRKAPGLMQTALDNYLYEKFRK